jgi:hypothetical protein
MSHNPYRNHVFLNYKLPHGFKRISVRSDRSRGYQLDAARREGLLRLWRLRNAICQWNLQLHTPDLGRPPPSLV